LPLFPEGDLVLEDLDLAREVRGDLGAELVLPRQGHGAFSWIRDAPGRDATTPGRRPGSAIMRLKRISIRLYEQRGAVKRIERPSRGGRTESPGGRTGLRTAGAANGYTFTRLWWRKRVRTSANWRWRWASSRPRTWTRSSA